MPTIFVVKFVGSEGSTAAKVTDGPLRRTFARDVAVEVTLAEYEYFRGKRSFKSAARHLTDREYAALRVEPKRRRKK